MGNKNKQIINTENNVTQFLVFFYSLVGLTVSAEAFFMEVNMKDYKQELMELELKRRLDEVAKKTGGCTDVCDYGKVYVQWMHDCREGVFNEDN